MIDKLILFRIGQEGQKGPRKANGTVGRTFHPTKSLASILGELWDAGEVPTVVSMDRGTVTVAIRRQSGPELSTIKGAD